ncbi:tripartite tricarboxylate transporter TctB family protein [Piscinibacter terrae]|uniref:Tripartite tricarboxylate transporter TctB family protein n=1 Tax=Piscinibacter terrae TaxID=2496871 RepID=A0A3N7JSG1_9BURK|nr:tripartite tricarboxylate transporter TctB family protein [Albitalea terrae]RQP23909.1 tripartite tricarboxylate transporter TctB family protein [Albitalea terrae]
MKNRGFLGIGAGIVLIAMLLAVGATQIPSDAGYAGAGPNFLPWVVSAAMALVGVLLIVSALRAKDDLVSVPDFPPRWRAVAWVSLGLILNAALIEHIGFVGSCAVLFALAARGFRVGSDQKPTLVMLVQDLGIGAAISAPVFWLFTKVLHVSLPALITGGWI